jgi:hypothetical protein
MACLKKTGTIFLLVSLKYLFMAQSTWKSLLVASTGMLIILSCSSSKNSTVVSRDKLKGSWTLDNISYEGIAASEKLRLVLLEEGNEACLKGSNWSLPNNGYGHYTINASQSGCIAGQKNIVWSYRKDGDQPYFQYKKLPGGEKAKDVTEGYRFKIISASGDAMVLQSEITYQGKPILINYSFTKG